MVRSGRFGTINDDKYAASPTNTVGAISLAAAGSMFTADEDVQHLTTEEIGCRIPGRLDEQFLGSDAVLSDAVLAANRHHSYRKASSGSTLAARRAGT